MTKRYIIAFTPAEYSAIKAIVNNDDVKRLDQEIVQRALKVFNNALLIHTKTNASVEEFFEQAKTKYGSVLKRLAEE